VAPAELVVAGLVGLAILIGVLGTILPLLPGLVLIWVAIVIYGIVTGFGVVGWVATIVVTGLMLLGFYLNVRIPQRRASVSGISTAGQLLGLALAIVGFFVIPVVGAPIGFVLGVFGVRYRATRDAAIAWTGTKSVIGSLLRASAAQAAIGLAMAAVWLVWVTVDAVA
jgi:uncharacterized protein YqgC (DUF456 family)